MIYTVTLNPSIDRYIFVEHLQKDGLNRSKAVMDLPGGKGINVSKVLMELGGKTMAYAMVGGFAGRSLKKLLKNLGISFKTIDIEQETRTNFILNDLRDGTQTQINPAGPMITGDEMARMKEMLLRCKPKPAFWVFSGSLPKAADKSVYREMIDALQSTGDRCVLDADDHALKMGLEAKPFMIKPNEHEMTRLMGCRLHTIRDHLQAAKILIKKGVRIVVISRGREGAIFVSDDKAYRAQIPAVTVKNKVGAGDALIAGTLFGLGKNLDLKEAARYAVATAASAVMRGGPKLCHRQDLAKLLTKTVVRGL